MASLRASTSTSTNISIPKCRDLMWRYPLSYHHLPHFLGSCPHGLPSSLHLHPYLYSQMRRLNVVCS
ncbi:hypothetical protein DAI22_02g252900 [Oryza sativa Japonica Group]|nr:hypothetical protein DAI22_02g252900 [Oryza sativa Japonica Group]